MKITQVKVRHVGQSLWGQLGKREEHLPLITPLAGYQEYRHPITTWFWASSIAVIEIIADDGTSGVGWCEDGCNAITPIIDNHLVRLLLGRDPAEIEGLWDRMFRASIPYGRKGVAIEAISAIDIALWDLLGKAAQRPVCELLGGPVRASVPLYASGLHHVEPEKVFAEAQEYVRQGYRSVKLRFRHGPSDGVVGMRSNEEHVKVVREAVGDDIAIMADAYMGWNLPYAAQMCRRLEKYDLAWLEEPFIPDELHCYAQLRRQTSIPIAGGEHEFTRYGFQQIIEQNAMDILQPDLHRCGGISEGRKIATLASAAGLSVIPHAYSAAHIHFVAATPNAPLLEYFPLPVWETTDDSGQPPLLVGEPVPAQAHAPVPRAPGLGVSARHEAIK